MNSESLRIIRRPMFDSFKKQWNIRGTSTCKTLEVLGLRHEFSVVGNVLRVLPIVDEILKDFHGLIVISVELGDFTFGKELQLHVMEIKPSAPFRSSETFGENMQTRVAWKNACSKRGNICQSSGKE